jgi:tetratricopeptide (TPR) repeat protein
VKAGNLSAARARFEQSLAISERLAKADPTAEAYQIGLSESLRKLGEVLAKSGDVPAARARLKQSVSIAEHLDKANPKSAIAQRVLLWSYATRGKVTEESEWFQKALRLAERLKRAGQLTSEDEHMLEELSRQGKHP